MYIKEIISQTRRDFTAIYKCDCGHEQEGGGYDDDNFHKNVIPQMICDSCGKKGNDEYAPRKTKYESWEQV